MQDKTLKSLAQRMVDGVDFAELFRQANEKADHDQVNLWLPKEYKVRYLAHQKASKKQFGRMVIELVKMCIDEADRQKAG